MSEELNITENLIDSPLRRSDVMSALFSSINDAVIVIDQNGKIVFGNDAAIRINDGKEFPKNPKDRVHQYSALIDDAEHSLTFDELPSTKTLFEGEVKGQELILTGTNGKKKFLQFNGRALYGQNGEKIGAVLAFHDDTSHRIAKDKMAVLEKEQVRLLHLNAELEHFSAIAAHDLKSPLNSITQFAELLKEDYGDKLGPDGGQFLQIIINAGDRLRNLIDDLLNYARAGKDLGELTTFDSRILIDEILVSLNGQIKASNATIEVSSLPVVTADRIGLSQVFQNLISNALKYRSEKAPEIKISVTEMNDHWLFQIKDNGIGIKFEDQKYAFDLFKRLEGSQKVEGTGLGLPICKRIIDFHGGSLSLESQLGRGTVMSFTLPRALEKPLQEIK